MVITQREPFNSEGADDWHLLAGEECSPEVAQALRPRAALDFSQNFQTPGPGALCLPDRHLLLGRPAGWPLNKWPRQSRPQRGAGERNDRFALKHLLLAAVVLIPFANGRKSLGRRRSILGRPLCLISAQFGPAELIFMNSPRWPRSPLGPELRRAPGGASGAAAAGSSAR